jgi:hypothetical protein
MGELSALKFLTGFLRSLPQTLTQRSARLCRKTSVSLFFFVVAILRKAIIRFIKFARSSAHPTFRMEQLRSHGNFHKI